MIAIDNILDITFAREILALSKIKLSLSYVPVRWKGNAFHWMHGHLIDVAGQNLVVKPLNGTPHKKTELLAPTNVKLWTSRMTRKQVRLVEEIRSKPIIFNTTDAVQELQSVKADILSHPPSQQSEKEIQELLSEAGKMARKLAVRIATESVPLPSPVVEVMATNSSEIIMSPPKVETPQPQLTVPQEIKSSSSTFAVELAAFKEMRNKLFANAKTDGLAHLRRLRADYDETLGMLAHAVAEMKSAMDDLSEMGVEVPSEITDGIAEFQHHRSKRIPSSNGHDTIQQLNTITPERKSNWSYVQAAAWKDRILKYMREHPHDTLRGSEILKAVGFNKTLNPSAVLGPLVLDGVIVQYGEASRGGQPRYKAAQQVLPMIKQI